ncbi:unnamed protein product [Gordionus sp. m RMFG-2023]
MGLISVSDANRDMNPSAGKDKKPGSLSSTNSGDSLNKAIKVTGNRDHSKDSKDNSDTTVKSRITFTKSTKLVTSKPENAKQTNHSSRETKKTRGNYYHAPTTIPDQIHEGGEIVSSPFLIDNNVLAEFESMRSPYIGAFLKFLAEQYEDVHDYPKNMCGDHACVPWKVICRNNFYEVRRYPNVTTIRSSSTGMEYIKDGLNSPITRIFRYFMGENDRNIIMNMSVPIFIHPLNKTTSDNKQLFMELLNGGEGPLVTADIYPPYNLDPPKPTNPMLKIGRINSPVSYHRMFGGYAFPTTFVSKAKEFLNILRLNKQNVSSQPYFLTYNYPNKLVDRHNEILFKLDNFDPQGKYC